MKVVILPGAEHDLEAIGEHIARDAPRRAISFTREPRRSAMRVGTAPIAYALVPRYESIGIRRRIHGNYIIFYKIHEAQVFVLRILHGARDYGYLLERIANPRPSSAPR